MGAIADPGRPGRTPVDLVAAFVIRARRIAAHSLAQDPEVLRAQATKWKMTITDGHVSIARSLPDEERFESLAARIRPLTLKSEPIHHAKVMEALRRLVAESSPDISEELNDELSAVEEAWARWDTENLTVRGYTLQLARGETAHEEPSELYSATDTQLGAGWFYADVAHADPTGEKAIALEFPLAERYAAAVTVYSGLALVVIRALALVERLANEGHLQIPESAWVTPVSVDAGEVVRETSSAYVAPFGTAIPSIGSPVGAEWELVSTTTIERLIGTVHLTARLLAESGQEVARWPATTRRRIEGGKTVGVDLNLDDQVEIHLPMPDVREAECQVEFLGTADTNEGLLRGMAAKQLLQQARELILEDETGAPKLCLNLGEFSNHSSLLDRAALEVCRDLVKLEGLTNSRFRLLEELPSVEELIRRRVLRLLLEGRVTYATIPSIDVVTGNREPPSVVRLERHAQIVNSVSVPVPTLLLWHPNQQVRQMADTQVEGPIYRVTPPPSERFIVWAPDLQAPGFDPFTAVPQPWGIEELLGVGD